MKNEFDSKLRKFVDQLPEFEANAESWTAIEQYLDFSEKLTKSKNELKKLKAPEQIWTKIEEGIKIRALRSVTSWAIAATVIVIVGSVFFLKNYKKSGLSYSTEVSTLTPGYTGESDSLTLKFTKYLEYQCRNNSYVCNEPDFAAKKQKLEEVNIEITKIESVINAYGSSPSLVKTRINLENFKAQLIKDLVKKLSS